MIDRRLLLPMVAAAAVLRPARAARAANTTWNPADKTAGTTLSNGNLTATGTSGAHGVRGVSSQNSGKFYVEYTGTFAANESVIGFAAATAAINGVPDTTGMVVYHRAGMILVNTSGAASGLTALANGSLLCAAIDLTARLVWFRVGAAGNWNGNAGYNPATGTGGISIAAAPATLYPIADVWNGDSATANFGTTAFTGAVPAGFTAGWPVTSAISPVIAVGSLSLGIN